MRTIAEILAGLDTHERARLAATLGRFNACPADVARLERDGLVEFAGESTTGRTYYRLTPIGRRVALAVRRGD